ncbi:MAG: cation diffusion facilitator family transporter [Alphaproteobacteria bacterium]|nr:cation diffusion facilitator family transporter [Alphaproteobacteria bacterium]
MSAHEHHHDPKRGSAGRLLAAFVVILVFMVVEVVGGLVAGSLALIADATHMLTDAFALGLAAGAQYLAGRPADAKRHFGYRRAQVLAAFVNGVVLMCLNVLIVVEAVGRMIHPTSVQGDTMLVIAVLGLLANIAAYFILHGARQDNVNVRGALLHVVTDLLGSVAAIIAALVILRFHWYPIDPILSVFVVILIARSALTLMHETGHILLEGAPRDIDVEALIEGVKSAAPEVEDVHDVHIWQLSPEHSRMTLHARISDAESGEHVLAAIKSFLEERYSIERSTVQIEVGGSCPDEEGALGATVVARASASVLQPRGACENRAQAVVAAASK